MTLRLLVVHRAFFLETQLMMLTTDQEFFSAPAVAKLLNVDRNRVIQYIRRGELRAVDVSLHRAVRPRWRISRKDLEAFLSCRSSTPQPEMKRRRKKKTDNNIIEFYR